jgi:lipoprotein signal peptidase
MVIRQPTFPLLRHISEAIHMSVCLALILCFLAALFLRSVPFGALLFLAGGSANAADWLLHGYITDFIRLGPLPIFNFADLIVGWGLLASLILVFKKKDAHAPDSL